MCPNTQSPLITECTVLEGNVPPRSKHLIDDRLSSSPPLSLSQPKKICVSTLSCRSSICLSPFPKHNVEVRVKKSVSFDEEKLTEIIEFEDDAESKSSRKLFWEVMAADRLRFKDRINRLDKVLSPILSKSHRDVVYVHRVLKSESSPCTIKIDAFEMVMVSPEL